MSYTLCPFIHSSLFLNFHKVSFRIGVGFELPRVKIKDFTMKRQILSVYSYLNANAKVQKGFQRFCELLRSYWSHQHIMYKLFYL